MTQAKHQILARDETEARSHKPDPLLVDLGLPADDGVSLIRVCMKNLRYKLERNPSRPQHILTEVGLGYRLRTGENL